MGPTTPFFIRDPPFFIYSSSCRVYFCPCSLCLPYSLCYFVSSPKKRVKQGYFLLNPSIRSLFPFPFRELNSLQIQQNPMGSRVKNGNDGRVERGYSLPLLLPMSFPSLPLVNLPTLLLITGCTRRICTIAHASDFLGTS